MNNNQFIKSEALINTLFAKHGLGKKGWTFSWSEMTSFSSLIDHSITNIKISKFYVISSTVKDSDILNTMLNDISKVLVTGQFKTRRQYNKAWKKKCEEIGGTPQSTCDPFTDKEYYKFHLTCKDGCFVGKMRMKKSDMKVGCYECLKHGNELVCEKNKNVKQLNF